MADESGSILGDLRVTEKFHAMVIDILVTCIVLSPVIQHLTCRFILDNSSEDLRPKILKEHWKSSVPRATMYYLIMEHFAFSVEESMSQCLGSVFDFAIPDSFLLGSVIRILVPQTLIHPNSLGQAAFPSAVGAELFWC